MRIRNRTVEVPLDSLTPDPKFELPADPKLTALIALAMKREIPITRATVPLPDIRVHDSERMRQIRAALLEAASAPTPRRRQWHPVEVACLEDSRALRIRKALTSLDACERMCARKLPIADVVEA